MRSDSSNQLSYHSPNMHLLYLSLKIVVDSLKVAEQHVLSPALPNKCLILRPLFDLADFQQLYSLVVPLNAVSQLAQLLSTAHALVL